MESLMSVRKIKKIKKNPPGRETGKIKKAATRNFFIPPFLKISQRTKRLNPKHESFFFAQPGHHKQVKELSGTPSGCQ
jgi:hypothetical protein